jgi:hypothetical protein
MSEKESEAAAKGGGFGRLPWVAAAVAAFASYEVAPLIAFWGAQMKGAPANIGELGETPYLHFLNKAATAGRPAAVVAAIVAVIAVMGAPDTRPGVRATIIGAVAGAIGGCIAGFLMGYFS